MALRKYSIDSISQQTSFIPKKVEKLSKEAYYFSHDANARQDEKILMLRAEHGWEGYGIYWALIEMMFESGDSCLSHNKIKGIAVSYNIEITLLQGVINTCIVEELFDTNEEKFWSESLIKRKTKYHEIKQKKSDAGKKGMEKRWRNKDSDNSVITDDNSVITKDNKGKEIKEKEIKVKEIKEIKVKDKVTTSPKRVYDEQSIHYQLSLRLYKNILINSPDYKEPNLHNWANDVRLMIEQDKRTSEQISYLMDWVQNDSFWKSNILSVSKLREKFDQLAIRVKEDINKQNRSNKKEVPRAYQSLQDWADEE